jgi:hypothetical protein
MGRGVLAKLGIILIAGTSVQVRPLGPTRYEDYVPWTACLQQVIREHGEAVSKAEQLERLQTCAEKVAADRERREHQ